jgi:hypothetical protein
LSESFLLQGAINQKNPEQATRVNEVAIKNISKPYFLKSDECSICLASFFGEMVVKTPCKHEFHERCIEQQLIYNPTCPLCRRKLSNKRNQKEGEVTMLLEGLNDVLEEDMF